MRRTRPTSRASPFGVLRRHRRYRHDALVPAAYYTWQIRPDLWIGMSVNSPFGLSVKEPGAWAGGGYGAILTNLKTYNATPSFAYRINDWISIGAGVQIQYAQTTFGFAYNALGAGTQAGLNGGGWGYGFTAGVTLTPTQNLTVGIGYRSGINQKLNGALMLSCRRWRHTWIDQCDRQSAGHRYGQRSLPVCPAVDRIGYGRVVELEPDRHSQCVAAQWCARDRWWQPCSFAVPVSGRLVLLGRRRISVERPAGATQRRRLRDVAQSPTRCACRWCRTTTVFGCRPAARINSRTKISLDLAYTHVFLKSTSINITAASGNPWFKPVLGTYVGDVSSHVDIVSVGFHYRWDNPAPAPVGRRSRTNRHFAYCDVKRPAATPAFFV